ncbi:hypothetical protein ACE7GA_01375 [Roseomonas sp. CCTCC AB2023176]|uniref:hypothetical protein n=1 Tax=Roseomonas sp. CCTCC AB2023176 TaxID=3342640 RepID=UPI0035D8DDFA
MTVSTSILSFRAVDQNLWAPGAAIELGIDTGEALIIRPEELKYDLDIGGSFLGFSGELYANFVFGLFAYAEIGEAGRFGGGIDIVVNASHNAVVSGNGEGIIFDFSDYSVGAAQIGSQGFSVGAKAGLDLVVGFELGIRDITYAIFGFQDTASDFKIIDLAETHIPLLTAEPFQTELPFDLGLGLELTLRVPSGANTQGSSFGSVVVRSDGVSDSPFIELSADLDQMLVQLLKKIPFPPLAVVANVLENTIFAEFEFDLNDYVPGIGADVFGVSATVLDIGASVGAAVSEKLALDFSNGDGKTPNVNITLRSDNGTPGDLSDDFVTFAKLGDTNVNVAGPNFEGFGPVKVEATYELNRARFSHSVGLDLVGGFTIDILKAETTGYIGEKLGISFGPLLSFSFPENGFRVGILQDLYTNAFDVAGGAFNTVKDTYEVFYSQTLPVGINTEKPGAVQQLIAYNEQRQINIAASNVTFEPIINGRPAAAFLNGNAVDVANTPQVASWFADRPNAHIDMEGDRNSTTRDIVRIDVQNQNNVPFVSQLEARYFVNGINTPFPLTGFLSAAQATSDAGYIFVNSLPSSSFINQSGGGGLVSGTRLVYRYGGQQVTTPNSVNILGNTGDDLLVYWGDETQLLDGGGQVAESATGDVLIANFGKSHALDAIEWDLRPSAVGQSGQSVGLSLTRGPVLYGRNASQMEKIGFVNDPLQVGRVEIPADDADGRAILRTPAGDLNLNGTFVVRLGVEDLQNGASTFELRVLNAVGSLVQVVGSQVTNHPEVGGTTSLRDLVFKDVELKPGDRIEIVADRGVIEGPDAEAARIFGIAVHEQHEVTFRNIESFVLTLSSYDDILFTSTGRDRISFGAGEDTLFLTADTHAETMDMGSGADVVLAELRSSAQLGNTASVNDDIYGQTGADEAIVRNLSDVGAQWVTRTPPVGSGNQIVVGPLAFNASAAQLNTMLGQVDRLWDTPFRENSAAGLPQTTLTGDFIRVQVTQDGRTNSVTFTEFEALSFEGSETANDLAVYFGGTYYRGGISRADTFAADFGTFDRPAGTTTGVVISGFNAAASALIGAPTTSPFPTAPTRFTYDDDLRFADGELVRTSEIQGFERLIVTGTTFKDILVGGIYDDYLAGGGGDDILVGGGSRNYDTTFSTIRTNQLSGGDGADTYYTNGDERTEIATGTDGIPDLLIFAPGNVVSVAAALGNTLVGLRQTFDFIAPGPADITYQANSSSAALLAAMDQLSAGLVSRDFFFATGSGLGAFTDGPLRTNLTGLAETDDLFIYDGGATYRGGERPGDADVFVADFSAQTFGITLNVEQDAAGVLLGNGVFISGLDRVVLRLGSGGDLVAGGLLDDVIYGGDGSDVLRGGGAVAGDSLFGGAGADLFGWQVSDGISNIDGGSDPGETAETPIVDRVLISAVGENGLSLAGPGDGLAVQLFINLGGGAEDFDPLFLDAIGADAVSVDIPRLLFVENVATVRVWSGDNYVAMRNIEATEVQGSNEGDDLVWYQNGTFYDGGDRDGDKDVFVAVLLDETADISINARSGDDRVPDDQVFYDIGNGTRIGNFEQIMVRLGSGNDEVFGGEFDDFLQGNGGDDLLDGGEGRDTVSGGAGDDRLFFTGGFNEVIDGGSDFDTIEINAIPSGISSVYGLTVNSADPDSFTITSFNDVDDISSAATMRSELASLMANLGTTNGFLVGGSGVSLRVVNVERVVISAEEGRDMLVSGTGGGVLSGDGGADVLVSLGGDDLLVGGEGLDRYAFGGAWGHDVIGGEYAGAGEIHFFGWSRAQITFSLAAPGSDDLLMSNVVGDTVLFMDYFRNGPNGLGYTFAFDDQTAVGLNLTALGAVSSGPVAVGSVFFGTDGRDVLLEGTNDADSYFAREGNDLITGSPGPDIISGGLGLDAVIYAKMVVGSRAEAGVTVDLGIGYGLGGDADGDILISIEDALGSGARDLLIGSDGRNALAGGEGDDTLRGLKGEDFLSGDGGNDSLRGGDGDDVIKGGTGRDSLFGEGGNDYLGGGAEADTLAGGTGNDTAVGGEGSDSVDLDAGDDTYIIARTVSGLVADAGLDTVNGGAGEDTIELSDFMTGGVINLGGSFDVPQTVASNGVTDIASQGAFVTVATLTGFENAVGSNFRDTVLGNSGANKLAGASGDDLLLGFQGNDTLVGGAGIDQVSYAAEGGSGAVLADLATGLVTDTYGNTDTLIEVEWLIGSNTSAFDDLLGDDRDNIFTGNKGAGVDQMDGRGGVDTVDYSIESDTQNYLPDGTTPGPIGVGIVVDLSVTGSFSNPNATDTSGHGDLLVSIENIIGSIRADAIKGSAADNLFVGGDGNDTLDGGPGGFDTVDYRQEIGSLGVIVDDSSLLSNRDTFGDVDLLIGIERIVGTDHADFMRLDSTFTREAVGGDGDDHLEMLSTLGAADRSRLFGGDGNDTLIGSGGADYLFGGSGSNESYGFGGDDTYLSTGGSDFFDGGAGDNEVSFELLAGAVRADLTTTKMFTTDTTSALTGAQRLVVSHSSVSAVTGSAFADAIEGNSGSNRLKGGSGDDTIAGGDGVDSLDGGAGVDTLDYTQGTGGVSLDLTIASNNATDGFGNRETVTGFERFLGTAFDDTFKGDDKAQTFATGAGSDVVDGGGGFDTLDLSQETGALGATFQISFDPTSGTISAVVTDSFGALNFVTSVEHFIGTNGIHDDLFGGDGNDMLTGNAGSEVDQLFGGNGIDTVDYSFERGAQGIVVDLRILGATAAAPNATDSYGDHDALQSIENVVGSAFGDSIDGGAEANVFSGLDGADTFSGGDGADTISGGLGLDTIRYDLESGGAGITVALQGGFPQVVDTFGKVDSVRDIEAIVGTAQVDVMSGNDAANLFSGLGAADTLDGWVGDDTLDGGSDDDVLLGWSGDDSLVGGAGEDQLFGEDDDDTLLGGTGADVISGGDGFDTASYSGSVNAVTILLASGAAVGTGGDATGDVLDSIENLTGSDGADVLAGDAGDNLLDGGGGNDTLGGGRGDDGLQGGGGADSLLGGDGQDVLDGGEGNDTLDGGSAVDQLRAGAGNDRVIYDAADTTVDGGEDGDTLVLLTRVNVNLGNADQVQGGGSATNFESVDASALTLGVVLTGSSAANSLAGGSGNDSLNGSTGDDTLIGGAGDDTLTGGTGTDTVSYGGASAGVSVNLTTSTAQNTGGAGTDLITGVENAVGSAHADTLTGTNGANLLDGGAGADSLVGGLGDDVYVVDSAADVVMEGVNAGIDTVHAGLSYTLGANLENLTLYGLALSGAGNNAGNVITGSDGANVLSGSGGNDTLLGGGGQDTLDGGNGADSMAGGAGDDTYVVDDAGDVVNEAEGDGVDTVTSILSLTLAAGLENLTLLSTAAAGTGNALANRIVGNGIANTLAGLGGADTLEGGNGNDTLDGGTEADSLAGSFGVDSLVGGDGNDTLDGGAGDDALDGGLGDDTYLVNAALDALTDAGGVDTVVASLTWTLGNAFENLTLAAGAGNGTGNGLANRLTGNAAGNVLAGGSGNDTLEGGGGNDRLNGMSGADVLRGGAGNDTYFVDNALDVVDEAGGDGIDIVSTALSFTLSSGVERLTLTGTGNATGTGNGEANRILGNAGANLLAGLDGADELRGGAGNDTLLGGTGADRLYGDAGADTFRYASIAEGGDVIYAFAAADDGLEVSAAGFGGGLAAGSLAAGRFASNTTGLATSAAGTGQFVYETDAGRLWWDADGAGGANALLLATLFARPQFTAADITIIA